MDIQNELAQTTFEDLLKMKDKLGNKIYRENVLAKLVAKSQERRKQEESDDEDEAEEEDGNLVPDFSCKRKRKDFQRSNRGEPIEASSKKIDYRYNFSARPQAVIGKKKKEVTEHRDPRFDARCGQFDPKYFQKDYSFINDMKHDEINLLRKEMAKTKSESRKAEIKQVIRRMENQLRADQEQQQTKEIVNKVTSKFNESAILPSSQQVSGPNKPKLFINKSLLKKAALAEKFKKLKQTGQLEKYLAKKRKKNVSKDRRFMARKRD